MELEQVMTALRNAHAAGDTAAARRLAQIATAIRDGQTIQHAQPQQEQRQPAAAAAPPRVLRPTMPETTGQDFGDSSQLRQEAAAFGMDYIMPQTAGEFVPGGSQRGFAEMAYDNLVGNPDDGITSPGERLGSWIARVGETGSLGLIGDEANAAAYSMLPGRTRENELARMRQNEEDLGWAGRLSADIVGSLIPGLGGVSVTGRAAQSLGGRMAVGAGLGAGAGAVNGFMEGEGGFANRASGGALGAVGGAVIGGAVPLAAEVGRSAVRAGSDMLRNSRVGREVGNALAISPQTGRVLSDVIGADDQAAMAQALGRAGPRNMLADASPALGNVLSTSLQSPVPGVQMARDRIAQRAGQSFDDVMGSIQGGQPEVGVREAMRNIAAETAQGRGDAYLRAYTSPIDYSAPAGREVERIVNAIPERIARRAVEQANERIIWDVNRGVLPEGARQIMAQIDDAGRVVYQEMPNVMQLDYIKRALDGIAETGSDAFGRLNDDGRFASDMARTLRNAVRDAVPAYGEALERGADAITRRNAVEFGTRLLSPRTTTEEALERITQSTGPQLEAMRDGVRGQLREIFGNVAAVASDQNVDARQAAAALRALSSPNAQTRMEALFGDAWPGIRDQIEQAGSALGLRARVATGSQTAGRQFTGQRIDDVTTPSALQRGEPVNALRNFVGGLTGASPDAIARTRQGVRSELADVLTRQGGTAEAAIGAVRNALAGNPYSMNAGGNIAFGLGLGGFGALPMITENALAGLGLRN